MANDEAYVAAAGSGGPDRDQTDDLVVANDALYQLSYCPKEQKRSTMVGLVRFELTTSCTPCKRATRLRYSPNKRRVTKTHAPRRSKRFFEERILPWWSPDVPIGFASVALNPARWGHRAPPETEQGRQLQRGLAIT